MICPPGMRFVLTRETPLLWRVAVAARVPVSRPTESAASVAKIRPAMLPGQVRWQKKEKTGSQECRKEGN